MHKRSLTVSLAAAAVAGALVLYIAPADAANTFGNLGKAIGKGIKSGAGSAPKPKVNVIRKTPSPVMGKVPSKPPSPVMGKLPSRPLPPAPNRPPVQYGKLPADSVTKNYGGIPNAAKNQNFGKLPAQVNYGKLGPAPTNYGGLPNAAKNQNLGKLPAQVNYGKLPGAANPAIGKKPLDAMQAVGVNPQQVKNAGIAKNPPRGIPQPKARGNQGAPAYKPIAAPPENVPQRSIFGGQPNRGGVRPQGGQRPGNVANLGGNPRTRGVPAEPANVAPPKYKPSRVAKIARRTSYGVLGLGMVTLVTVGVVAPLTLDDE